MHLEVAPRGEEGSPEQLSQQLTGALDEHLVKLEDGFEALAVASKGRAEIGLLERVKNDLDELLAEAAALKQQQVATDWLTKQLGGVLDAHAVKLQDGFESLAAASKARSGSELTERVESDLWELLLAAQQQQLASDGLAQQMGGVLDEHAIKLEDKFEELSAKSKSRVENELADRAESDLRELLEQAAAIKQQLEDQIAHSEEVSNALLSFCMIAAEGVGCSYHDSCGTWSASVTCRCLNWKS